ncbi:iron permease FTR1/Fip1/EfeU [Pseudomassariella vexata]|uniref:Iron permease FTR1/Fip1/EfeU n=1 Tax=Pseudomassariella vexata TaxID=1141098 RepID=A0A1Y2D7B5_9PEZI|nr:iron permease FTR1/Fip1/EfeU [Pseudomassariella vexata]ORY55097.1 iron permease FTR1/Fip1/EfeU [Pseudomassariella vexata]
MPNVFAVPVFLIVFRETLETVIIVSVLLAFLKQTLGGPDHDAVVYKKLVKQVRIQRKQNTTQSLTVPVLIIRVLQVWLGVGLGLLICVIVAGGLIGAFYTLGKNAWESSEYNYEGAFALVAAVIITVVGAGLLRIGKMQEKWRVKLATAFEGPVQTGGARGGAFKRFAEKYAMFYLPFITVLREGIEAIVFLAGVTFSAPATAVPLPVVVGLAVGIIVGYILYKGGASAKLKYFLIASTCLLYLVAAGLFSRSVWYFEQQKWNNIIGGDAAELGTGPGSYDIDKSVWHVNCCSPELNGGEGWGIFNAILGWTNSATYGSVISYNVYWIFVIAAFFIMRYREVKGHWPLKKSKHENSSEPVEISSGARGNGIVEYTAVATEKT